MPPCFGFGQMYNTIDQISSFFSVEVFLLIYLLVAGNYPRSKVILDYLIAGTYPVLS
jgi:hypothetical protein